MFKSVWNQRTIAVAIVPKQIAGCYTMFTESHVQAEWILTTEE